MNTVANKIGAINPTIYQSDLYLKNAINGKICFRSMGSAIMHFEVTHEYEKRHVNKAYAQLNPFTIYIIWATITNIIQIS
jgi:hypothetical protein